MLHHLFRITDSWDEAPGSSYGILPAPAAPSSLTAPTVLENQVSLSWTDNSTQENAFKVQRATNNTFTTGLTEFTTAANATSYNDTTVAGGTTYYYRVYATQTGGPPSTYSNTVTAAVPVNAPSGLAGGSITYNSATLTWTDNSPNETNFTLQRATNVGFTTGLTSFNIAANTTSYNDSATLTPSTTYYYRVKAIRTGETDSAWSNTATVVTTAAPSGSFATGNLASTLAVYQAAFTHGAQDQQNSQYIFSIGGKRSSSTLNETNMGLVQPETGLISSWNSVTALPQALSNGAAVRQGLNTTDNIIHTGGETSAGTPVNNVYRASVNGLLSLSSWSSLTAMTAVKSRHAAAQVGENLYVIAGITTGGAATNTVYGANTSSGTISSWTTVTAFPVTGTDPFQAAVYGEFLYVLGNGTTIYLATPSMSSTPSLTSWTSVGTTSFAGVVAPSMGVTIIGGKPFLQVLGGQVAGSPVTTVDQWEINTSTGTLGTRQTGVSLPAVRSYSGSVSYQNRIYVLGGIGASSSELSTYTVMSPYGAGADFDGDSGWYYSNNDLPAGQARGDCRTAALTSGGNTYLVSVGGYATGASTVATSKHMYAQIVSDNLMSWNEQTTGTVTPGLGAGSAWGHSSFLDRMWIMGGGSPATTTVRKGVINSSGILTWTTETSLPATLNSARHGACILGNYIYVVNNSGTIYYADVSSGSITSWSTLSAALPGGNSSVALIGYNGKLYSAGGRSGGVDVNTIYRATPDGSGNVTSWTTETATLTIPRSSHGIGVLTLGGFPHLYVLGGSVSGTGTAITYLGEERVDVFKINTTTGALSTAFIGSSMLIGARLYGCVNYNNRIYTFAGEQGMESDGSADVSILRPLV